MSPQNSQAKLLHNQNFIRIWISQISSVMAIYIANYALVLNLYKNTSSTLAASLLWISYILPILLVGPMAATIADLYDKKKILMVTNLLQAALMIVLMFVHERLFLVYGLVFFYSVINQLYQPAESASLPVLVKKEDLTSANGLFFLGGQSGSFVGIAIAGILFPFIGENITILVCAALLLLAFISVSGLPKLTQTTHISFEQGLTDFFDKMGEGYKYIKANKSVLYAITLIGSITISITLLAVNAPALADELFNISLEKASTLIVLPALLGAVIGILLLTRGSKTKNDQKVVRKRYIIQRSLMILGLGFLFLSTFIGYLPFSVRNFVVPVVAALIGASAVGIQIPAQTFLQESTPKHMLGRLMGNVSFMITLMTVVPLVFSGLVGEFIGARSFVFLLAVVCAVGYYLVVRHPDAIDID